ELVGDWCLNAQRWHPVAWRPDVLATRLFAWLGQYEFFCASADDTYRQRYLRVVAQQARHLARVLPGGGSGEPVLAALKGLIVAGVALPDRGGWIDQGLRLLEREFARQLLPDGGHVSRNPACQVTVLRHLVDTRGALLATGREVPHFLVAAIERAAPFLRMMRHSDGGLALFNGADEGESWLIDMLLAQADARGRPPTSAPHSGYERLVNNRTLVIVDTGPPPPSGLDLAAHAGALSFEMSVGKERVIVNCGAHAGDSNWAEVERATAAHSTLVVDDTNSAEILPSGHFGRQTSDVDTARDEADGSIWLDASHDGYALPFGLVHRRRLFLDAVGDDLRGEDTLLYAGAAARPATGFAVRFHLHPSVQASLVQNGAAALLRLPGGAGWRLRAQGGTLSLAESVYLGQAGETRRSEQIVVSGTLSDTGGEEAASVKWALQRIVQKS
ncbi:MAG: heparinase II/III family protein, partial [Alphaproteobacteria bacterium]